MRQLSSMRRSSSKIHPAVRSAALCEVMECRRMLAADATLSSGVLTIVGTSAADAMTVTKDGSKLKVKLNAATTKEFTYSNVNSIVVNLLGGNDSFLSFNDVVKPMTIFCGTGNDVVSSGGGDDVVFGEGGNDIVNVRNGDDVIDGGTGSDTANYSDRTQNLTITLDDVANDGGPGGQDNVKSNVENITGGLGNDLLIGDIDANNIFGFKGNDTIYGNSGNDTLDGGNASGGNNEIHGGPGNDLISGADGSDKLYGEAGNDSISGEQGNDSLYGGSENDTLKGDSGNDKSYGASGDDRIYDGAGSDYHEGWTGKDFFFADPDNDTQSDEFAGGADFDWIFYTGRDRAVRIQTDNVANDGYTGGGHGPGIERDNVRSDIEGLNGTDHADGIYAQGNVSNSIVGGKGPDYIAAGPGNDTVDAGEGDDWVFGEDGNDTLFGGAGKDSLDGGAFSDRLEGGSGNDELHGQSGNDTLIGGAGVDKLYGESGNDKLFSDDNIFGEIVNGGSGADTADVDTTLGAPLDVVSSCETIT